MVHSSSLTMNDFNDKCRLCLRCDEDMIDIFSSGIHSQMLELTNIKVSNNDRLPKGMCQKCKKHLEELYEFKQQAKDTDIYLRTLLLAEDSASNKCQKVKLKSLKSRRRKQFEKNSSKKKIGNSENDAVSLQNMQNEKIYLILVNDATNNSKPQSEICIKDLDLDSGNGELLNFCKSMINHKSSDDNKNSGPTFFTDIERNSKVYKDSLTEYKVYSESVAGKTAYYVNFHIFECSECEESFELSDDLAEHLKLHGIVSSSGEFKYTCPVCKRTDVDKNIFVNHLKDHRNEGYLFLKVNRKGDCLPVSISEQELFEEPKQTYKFSHKCKVYKVNIDSYKCVLCNKLIESKGLIKIHMEVCYPDFHETHHLIHKKYTCPACGDTWIDEIENFLNHLISHRKDNVFFLKVDSFGESVELTSDDIAFTPFEEALTILPFERSNEYPVDDTKAVVKTEDVCSCHLCDYEVESYDDLWEHYSENHNEIPGERLFSCSVCGKDFGPASPERCASYFRHIRNHRNEGVHLLKINREGAIYSKGSDCLKLLSNDNDLLADKVKCPELKFIESVWTPEVFIERSMRKEYFCDLCPEVFARKREMVEHLKSHVKCPSGKSRDYICEKCGRKCFGKGNYKRHYLTHAEKCGITSADQKYPRCLVCGKAFANRATLNEHRRHHLKEGSENAIAGQTGKICETCGKGFSNNSSLAKHRKLHEGDRESELLKCKICQRNFRRESALDRHMSAHLNPNYFECDECKLPSPSLASLQRHKQVHQSSSNTFDCKVCKISFLSKGRLAAHQTHTGHHHDRTPFECNVCHEKFIVAKEFSQHIKLHPKYKMSECSLCGKRLSTMQSLMLHLGRHFESNSILCPHCGRQFFEERNYHRHLLTHEGFKPFPCDVDGCKKSFYTYFELNRHKKYHNNTRDFSCTYCPKSFHEANHLKVHIRTHTGERPYTCPHCSKGFATRTRCKHHINVIHQGVGCDLIQSNISKKVAVFKAIKTVS